MSTAVVTHFLPLHTWLCCAGRTRMTDATGTAAAAVLLSSSCYNSSDSLCISVGRTLVHLRYQATTARGQLPRCSCSSFSSSAAIQCRRISRNPVAAAQLYKQPLNLGKVQICVLCTLASPPAFISTGNQCHWQLRATNATAAINCLCMGNEASIVTPPMSQLFAWIFRFPWIGLHSSAELQ